MIGTIIGVKPVNFTNKETGEVIQGNRLYVVADDIDCFGKSCNDLWIGSGTPAEKKISSYLNDLDKLVGTEVEFSFKPKSSKLAQFELMLSASKKG